MALSDEEKWPGEHAILRRELADDLCSKADALFRMHRNPALFISEYFDNVVNEIDVDVEAYLLSLELGGADDAPNTEETAEELPLIVVNGTVMSRELFLSSKQQTQQTQLPERDRDLAASVENELRDRMLDAVAEFKGRLLARLPGLVAACRFDYFFELDVQIKQSIEERVRLSPPPPSSSSSSTPSSTPSSTDPATTSRLKELEEAYLDIALQIFCAVNSLEEILFDNKSLIYVKKCKLPWELQKKIRGRSLGKLISVDCVHLNFAETEVSKNSRIFWLHLMRLDQMAPKYVLGKNAIAMEVLNVINSTLKIKSNWAVGGLGLLVAKTFCCNFWIGPDYTDSLLVMEWRCPDHLSTVVKKIAEAATKATKGDATTIQTADTKTCESSVQAQVHFEQLIASRDGWSRAWNVFEPALCVEHMENGETWKISSVTIDGSFSSQQDKIVVDKLIQVATSLKTLNIKRAWASTFSLDFLVLSPSPRFTNLSSLFISLPQSGWEYADMGLFVAASPKLDELHVESAHVRDFAIPRPKCKNLAALQSLLSLNLVGLDLSAENVSKTTDWTLFQCTLQDCLLKSISQVESMFANKHFIKYSRNHKDYEKRMERFLANSLIHPYRLSYTNTKCRIVCVKKNLLTEIKKSDFSDSCRNDIVDLNLRKNQISFFEPNSLPENLERLNLKCCRLRSETLQSCLMENKLSNLTCLNLAENRLTTVNFSWFAGATNLNSLNLDSNLITNLETPGADLSFFSNLRYLYLSNNCIKSLPKMRLPMLKLLAADGNEIEELEPDFFGALPEINHVNFERNKLSFSITAQTFSACNHLLCLQFAFNKRVEIIVTVDVEEQQTVVARDGVAPFFSQFIEYLSIDVPLSSFFSRTSGTTTHMIPSSFSASLAPCCKSKSSKDLPKNLFYEFCSTTTRDEEADFGSSGYTKAVEAKAWGVKNFAQLSDPDIVWHLPSKILRLIGPGSQFRKTWCKCLQVCVDISERMPPLTAHCFADRTPHLTKLVLLSAPANLDRRVFNGLKNIQDIELSNSSAAAQSIVPELFRGLFQLKRLCLAKNNLENFSLADLLALCPSISSLDLSRNKLDDRSTEGLSRNDNGCGGGVVSHNLSKLVLSENELESMCFVYNMSALIILNLAKNRIRSPFFLDAKGGEKNSFARLSALEHVDLRENQIAPDLFASATNHIDYSPPNWAI